MGPKPVASNRWVGLVEALVITGLGKTKQRQLGAGDGVEVRWDASRPQGRARQWRADTLEHWAEANPQFLQARTPGKPRDPEPHGMLERKPLPKEVSQRIASSEGDRRNGGGPALEDAQLADDADSRPGRAKAPDDGDPRVAGLRATADLLFDLLVRESGLRHEMIRSLRQVFSSADSARPTEMDDLDARLRAFLDNRHA